MRQVLIALTIGAVFIGLGYLAFTQIMPGKAAEPGAGMTVEQRLKNPKSIPEIEWSLLQEFDFQTNKGPKKLMDLDNKLVRIAGFVVPLTDNYSELQDFLLVPDPQSCIHVPPPPPNLILQVKLREIISSSDVPNPIWLTGVFKIDPTTSKYGSASYSFDGIKLEPYVY